MQEDGHSVGQVSETGKALTKWHKIIRAREDLDFLSFLKAKTSSNSFPCLSANGLVIPRIGKKRLMDSEFPAKSAFFIKHSSWRCSTWMTWRTWDRDQHGGQCPAVGKVKKTKVQNFYRVARSSDLTGLYILQCQQSNDIGCILSVQGLILFY